MHVSLQEAQVQFFEAHFLDNVESAFKWAVEHTDIDVDEPREKKHYYDRAHDYVDKYDDVKSKGKATVYREVKLPSIDKLDKKDIGMHWSFEKSGAKEQGGNRYGFSGQLESFILTAEVKFSVIDWEYGFTSFIYYGEDQWECAIKANSKILLTSIVGEGKQHLKSPTTVIVAKQRP